MSETAKHIIKKGKADISAVLLIAFLFQLFTPILVFAHEQIGSNDFEVALRDSICHGAQVQGDNEVEKRQADGFVCEWCVTCKTLLDRQITQPEHAIILHARVIARLNKHPDQWIQFSQAKGSPARPRAPPVL